MTEEKGLFAYKHPPLGLIEDFFKQAGKVYEPSWNKVKKPKGEKK